MTPKVLTIHASTGNGHISAAVAIDETLRQMGVMSRVVDGLDFAPIAFRTWYGGGYEATVRTRPEWWGFLYRISDVPGLPYAVQTWSDEFFLKQMGEFLRQYRPDVVVCTHSLPQPKLATLREELGFRMAVVVTDLYPHKMWLRGDPDHFYVPQEWSREELDRRVPGAAARTTVTGIPVHEAFASVPDQVTARERLGLRQDRPVVLLSAGGIGAGDFAGAVRALNGIEGLQLMVVCGRNDRAYEGLTRQELKGSLGELRILKRVPVEEMATMMSAADLLVGKPGGLTVSEALAVGVPFVVHEPFQIPGQEADNARFLRERGIGVSARDNAEMGRTVRELLADPVRVAVMREASRREGKPYAAQDIATHVLELAQTPARARNG